MYRARRYRVYIVFAIFTVAAIYQFSSIKQWEEVGTEVIQGLEHGGIPKPLQATPLDDRAKSSAGAFMTSTTTYNSRTVTATPESETGDRDQFGLSGQGRHEAPPPLSDKPAIHWSMMPEHFPVPTGVMIALPTEKPIAIPKIQYRFRDESSSAKAERQKKQNKIKDAFKHAWSGYKTHAWLQDELSPVSGSFRNPFCEWAATLVDSLDTLWIMGLEEEFKEAVEAVALIDFTTSPRKDIPVFETTIRYLGGLIAAYDVSGGKYRTLIEKAEELAEVLYAAFDTPNRMPITYYFWRPTFAVNPHRASTRVVLAELGSLSMEFTRLAQITKKNKYYDAIARITDELEIWQKDTKIPGLWPRVVDTSGCKKAEMKNVEFSKDIDQTPLKRPEDQSSSSSSSISQTSTESSAPTAVTSNSDQSSLHSSENSVSKDKDTSGSSDISDSGRPSVQKRQINTAELTSNGRPAQPEHLLDVNPAVQKVDCEVQGLKSPPNSYIESFSLGGQADSTYEYLPKMHMLLGGTRPEYQAMYELAIEAANEYLLYRPMIPEEKRETLVMGGVDVQELPTGALSMKHIPEQTHLTCFVGGMYAIGSKIFERKADLETAAKLTEGCVWAYDVTTTGIMGERMTLIPCDSMSKCAWNQSKWYEELDPWRETREAAQARDKEAEDLIKAHGADDMLSSTSSSSIAEATGKATDATVGIGSTVKEGDGKSSENIDAKVSLVKDRISKKVDEPSEDSDRKNSIVKRQLGDIQSHEKLPEIKELKNDDPDKDSPIGVMQSESQYPTHEEFVETRIKDEHIAEGIPIMQDKNYKLRPEAIESVFIMYRITGDEEWREKGWRMFEAVQKYCMSQYGHSAIGDVTDPEPYQKDEMESFWLAETLKYFYLLFSTPDTISLDDWVLNTEAHPFRRPT